MARKLARAAGFVVFLSLSAVPPLHAQSPAMGPEFAVNTYTAGAQKIGSTQSVVVDSSGNFVVVWTSNGEDGDADGVFGRRFDGSGAPLGGEFQVNTHTQNQQKAPAIGMDSAGNFVVVWSSYYQAGPFQTDIYGQRYDSAGVPQGTEFHVNTYSGTATTPSIAVSGSGDFVVTWTSDGQDGSGKGIFARRFDASGSPLGGEFPVNTYTTGNQTRPYAKSSASGGFIIAWDSLQDGSLSGIYAQRYDSSGSPQGSEFQVNTYTAGYQELPLVGTDAGENFVIVWTSENEDGTIAGVAGRRFDASGAPQGGDFLVNTYTTGAQFASGLAMNASGDFVVTWASAAQDGSSYGVFGQRFNAAGRRVGAEFQVNTYTTGEQSPASVGMNDSGNFAIAWESAGQDGSSYGVFGKRGEFHAAQPMKVDAHQGTGTSSNGNGVLEPGETVQLEPAWMDTLTAPFTFTGTASNLTGPPGPTYTLDDATADYGTVAAGATTDCYDATPGHDCYLVTVSGARPAPHWDATFDEALTGFLVGPTLGKTWTLHVGGSFPDVPTSQQFYAFIENLFHNGITGGCGGGNYCPDNSVTRAQMAVFLLKGEHGESYAPPACSATIFADEPCPGGLFVDWVNQLNAEGITGGCGGGNYCPTDPVLRQQMAVFLLKAQQGSSYVPPVCTGMFADVPCPSQFANWIEQLATEGITGGCGGGNYCPRSPNTRGQMAVFLVKTFGLLLYGP